MVVFFLFTSRWAYNRGGTYEQKIIIECYFCIALKKSEHEKNINWKILKWNSLLLGDLLTARNIYIEGHKCQLMSFISQSSVCRK